MCGRYGLTEPEKIAKRFKVKRTPHFDLRQNWNVAPTQTMPIVHLVDGNREIEALRWGFTMDFKGVKKSVFNTRADKAFSPFWKKQVAEHRCLIPANYFYEWQKTPGVRKGKPFVISLPDMELYAFAGVWREWDDDDGTKYNAYSIMTTEPNSEMAAIHNRMPVILHEDQEEAWLDTGTNDDRIAELLFPSEDGRLKMYAGNSAIGNVKNNDDSLLIPAES